MSVSSVYFLLFAIAAAALHGVWRNTMWRSAVMLVANLAFIASFTHSPRALLPLFSFLLLGYVAVCIARFTSSAWASTLFAIGTLVIFCWLKKYWFLSFAGFLPFVYLTIGLSYAFFRVMGMIVDARTEPQIARVGPVDYFNFAMNFPTMVAGPIDRYQDFAKPGAPVTGVDIGEALQRIALGFFKLLVLSALVSVRQTAGTAALLRAGHGTAAVWPAVVSFGLYPVYLYFNFSGYTDIVLGIGRLFGKRYPENFNAPFSSYNFIEFWSRWHMSLSFWLRDYVYTPLLKRSMQMELPRAADAYLGVAAYFVTFFLIGIWHGSTAIFAVYGLVLALGVSVNKLYQATMTKNLTKKGYRELSAQPLYRWVCRGLTYTFYSFSMICFWNTGATATRMVGTLGSVGFAAAFFALLAVVIVLLNVFETAREAVQAHVSADWFGSYAPYARAITFSLLVFACIANAILTQRIDANIVYQAF